MSKTKIKTTKKQQLNLMCPIGGDNLGSISMSILKGFRGIDIDTSLFPILIDGKLLFNSTEEADICSGAIKYSRQFNYRAPALKIWHPHDLATRPGKGKYYSLVIPDTDYLTASEVHHLNYTDGIFVSSDWAKDILIKNQIKVPIHKISLGVDRSIFTVPEQVADRSNNNYIFYSTGKWSLSNGHDFLIKAFSLAFKKTDNVELRLLPTNDFLTEEETNKWLSLVDNIPHKEKIFLYNRLQTQYDMADFILSADCLLSPQRVCSTGTSISEAMVMNKPVIATQCGVVAEYPESEHLYRANIRSQEKAYDNRILYGESNWAKLDQSVLDETIDYMRHVYKNEIRSNPSGVEKMTNRTWHNTCLDILRITHKNKK
jgi:glycosyltransferase involved in cell wall biosynthesis